MRTRKTLCTCLLALFVLMPMSTLAAKHVIKIATLAPSKSAWMTVFRAAAKEVYEKTNGEIKIIVYGDGTLGDERTIIRKVKSGTIQGGAVTSVGLAQVAPDILVLQAPRLITTYKQLDCVRDQLKSQFEDGLAKQNMVLLGWGDVGYTYLFTNTPVRTPADLKKIKPWVWNADPLFQAFYDEVGASPIPLSVPKVLSSLNTKLINAYYASPLAAIALQWFRHSQYITKMRLAVGIGATVVSKSSWDLLSPAHQQLVRQISEKWHNILIKKVRKDNKKSVNVLKAKGHTIVKLTPDEEAAWERVSRKVQNKLAGPVYRKSLLSEARALAKKCK